MNDNLINNLVQDLAPVRSRRLSREAAWLLGLGLAELALYVALGQPRPDLAQTMNGPSFWWKFASLTVLTLSGVGVALRSFDPARSARRGLRWMVGIVLGVLAAGWIIDGVDPVGGSILARVDFAHGLVCLTAMTVLSLPPLIALGLLMRRGAATDPRGSALAVGAAGAAWGALIFAFHCPMDDPLYVAIWYSLGYMLVASVSRVLLPRITRW